MAQEDDGMADDGGASKPGDGKRARRAPPPVIELTATPVPEGAAPPEASPPAAASMEPAETVATDASKPDATKPDAANSAAAKTLRDSLKFAHPIEEMPHESAPPPPPPGAVKRGFGLPRSWPIIGAVAAAILLTAAVTITVSELSGGAPDEGATRRLTDRIGAMQMELDGLKAQLKSTTDPKETAALAARIAEIEKRFNADSSPPVPAGADAAKLTALETRVEDVTKRLATLDDVSHQVAEIAARLAKIEAALAQPRPSEADPALSNRVAAMDAAVKSLLGRITDLEKRLDTLAATAREAAAHPSVAAAPDRAIRLAFLATALRTAVERGEPFAAELSALKTLAPDKAALASLEAFAASGVPSANALSHELSSLVPALLAAANPPQGDASLMDRLGMKQLIRIRRVGDTPGDDPVSVIARIELKAAHDDVAGALAEFAKLPEGARAPAMAWIKKATQRIAAVDATRRLTADALAGLAESGPKPAP